MTSPLRKNKRVAAMTPLLFIIRPCNPFTWQGDALGAQRFQQRPPIVYRVAGVGSLLALVLV